MNDFFIRYFIVIYFLYGLSFFCMGLAILLEIGRSSELDFAKALRPLAFFGLLHGMHEWYEMFLLVYPETVQEGSSWVVISRTALLGVSFLLLVAFGANLIIGSERIKPKLVTMSIVSVLWLSGLIWVYLTQPIVSQRAIAFDVYTRYSLAIPGASLTAWGLFLQRRKFGLKGMPTYGRDLAFAAIAFLLYGVIGQLFAAPSIVFPSRFFNWDTFLRWFGFPIQVFRSVMAAFIAVFMVRSLRAFEEENLRQIEDLREAQLNERKRLEATRSELLHRTVKAQESERQRISRELHDLTGQSLTALGMGLRGLSETISINKDRAIEQARQLETLAVGGLEELQRMVTGLRPPQLDDLGLLAALRWCANDFSQRYNLPIEVTSQGNGAELPEDVRVVFFRIAQEAILNIVRHAEATEAHVHLESSEHRITLSIQDDGQGFDAETMLHLDQKWPSWGLLGMIERSNLVGADLEIDSHPGKGTYIIVSIEREPQGDG